MRKLRIMLGVILLVLSCALLIWGFLPAARERHILPLPPSELTLPTPSSFLPDPSTAASTGSAQRLRAGPLAGAWI